MTVKYAPHTSTSAATRARAKVGKANQIGMCAHEVIVNIFGIPGPWKWGGNGAPYAINYFLGSQKVVHTSDASKIPAGAMVFFGPRPGATTAGGKAGHVAVGAGGGYIYSTDLPTTGRWGKVKITEVTRQWSKPLVGYVLIDGKGFTLTDPPKVDARPKAGDPWFKIATFNMKAPSLTRTGAHKWTQRREAQVESIAALEADVLCVQEAGSGADLAWLDEHLKPHGLTRVPKGGNWRHIYVSDKCKVYKSGSYELTPLYGKDTKEAAWAVLTIGQTRALVTSMHLESDSSAKADPIRVAQVQNLVKQGAKTAIECEVQETRIFHAGDTNSRSQVAAAMKKLGFVSADKNAWKTTLTSFATINNWISRLKGAHEDYIFVALKRPVLTWTQRLNAVISDHNAVLAQIAAVA